MKLLIVDESEVVRRQVRDALAQFPALEVLEAVDGMEGLKMLQSTYDLAMVFTEVQLPDMKGTDFFQMISPTLQEEKVPVVVLTSVDDPALVRHCKQLGARGWMVKPSNTEQLARVVRRFTSPAAEEKLPVDEVVGSDFRD